MVAARRGAAVLALLTLAALLAMRPGRGVEAQEDSLEKTIDDVAARNEAAAESQRQVAAESDGARTLLQQYRETGRRIDALKSYNAQLERLIAAQRSEIESLRQQAEGMAEVEREIVPLMLRMLDSLERFVALDLPFLLDERRARLQGLRVVMDRADLTASEKYRRLIEAYQVENEYGRTMEAYRGSLETRGARRTVDFLRVGRVALIYQTLDRKEAGLWNGEKKRWEEIPEGDPGEITRALRIARRQTAPDLVRLPVPAPGVVR